VHLAAVGARADGSVVVVSPWDDSYGGAAQAAADGTQPGAGDTVAVSLRIDHLTDWRLLLATLFVFCTGALLGGILDHAYMRCALDEQARSARYIHKAMEAAGPSPVQGEIYTRGGVVGGNI